MASGYNHKEIEKKWQQRWAEQKLYEVQDKAKGKKNLYVLVEFPYPSGDLHVGHWYAFAVPDAYARMKRMQGHNVLYPIGFDSFGLPAENAAIKNGADPKQWTNANIDRMRDQLKQMGNMFDWSREIAASNPKMYKWTQWLFLQLFKNHQAYRKKAIVNWCPKDKTVLANEQVIHGRCERCDSEVEKKPLEQWFLKITKYADRLIDGLDKLEWPNAIKEAQKSWIGRTTGSEIDFPISRNYKFVLLHGFRESPESSFFPWLKTELEKRGHEVVVPELPNSENPTEEEWVSTALSATEYDESTILLGHSLGATTALKVLEKIDTKIAKAVLVGGFVDPSFKDQSRNFETTFNWSFDFEKISAATHKFILLHDENDVAISSDQADKLQRSLGVKLTRVDAEKAHFQGSEEPEVLREALPYVRVFTTRPDTLFGATFLVVAPEHPFVGSAMTRVENKETVQKYIKETLAKSDIERVEGKEKTGILLEGITVTNPASGENIPVYIGDYVLDYVGTGALMAVPAHDERDFEFAKKHNLPIRQVIVPCYVDPNNPPREEFTEETRNTVVVFVKNKRTNEYAILEWHGKQEGIVTGIMGGVEEGDTPEEAARKEILEEAGLDSLVLVKEMRWVTDAKYCAAHKGVNRHAVVRALLFEVDGIDEQKEIAKEEQEKHTLVWVPEDKVRGKITVIHQKMLWDQIMAEKALKVDGVLTNSGKFDGLQSEEAKKEITEFANGRVINHYRQRNWLISRQRYWGTPIPIVYDPQGEAHAVPDEHLPWLLPEDVDLSQSEQTPLARSKELQERVTKIFGEGWTPEVDTMDTFMDSAWYFMRYLDPRNEEEFSSEEKRKDWMPVDRYSGGAEHTTMHILYSRYFHKALFDIGLVKEEEPYTVRQNRGLIIAEDGRKMSKRWGNVVNPDEQVAHVGADSVKMYLAFIGPYNEVGSYPWNTNGLVGVRRFLERIWALSEKVSDGEVDKETETLLHQTIKKVEQDIQSMKFNTSVSALMILQNELQKLDSIPKEVYETMLKLLAPFAPHMTEELWEKMGHSTSIHLEEWPQYDEKKASSEKVIMAVQIAGKVRGTIEMPRGAKETEVLEMAKNNKKLAKYIDFEPQKVIFIPDRVINLIP